MTLFTLIYTDTFYFFDRINGIYRIIIYHESRCIGTKDTKI